MASIQPRSAWGAAPRSSTPAYLPNGVGLAIHWEGPRMGVYSQDSVPALLRGIQRYHQDTQGWCVDTETEILTRRGWLKWDEVEAGDTALAVDPGTWSSVWSPIHEVNVFDGDFKVHHFSGRTHDSVTTPNHRWLTERWDTHARAWVRGEWRTTSQLNNNIRIPTALPCAELPEQAKYLDAFVELVAWWAAEGGRNRRGGIIAQSPSANPRYCNRIRSVLTGLYGPATDKRLGVGPAWAEVPVEAARCINFRISRGVVDLLDEVAPRGEGARQPTVDFVLSLTAAQLRLFIETFIDGDGWRQGQQSHVAQKYKGMLDALQLAAVLLGIPTSCNWEPSNQRWRLSFRNVATAIPTGARVHSPGEKTVNRVWCPKTGHGTWYARRNGTCYFTGNSDVAYNFLVDRYGGLWEARGWNARSAANGTNDANSRYLAVCYLGGEGDDFTPAAQAAIASLYAQHVARGGSAEVVGHRDCTATACPGDTIYAWVHSGGPGGTYAPAAQEEDDVTEDDRKFIQDVVRIATDNLRAAIVSDTRTLLAQAPAQGGDVHVDVDKLGDAIGKSLFRQALGNG